MSIDNDIIGLIGFPFLRERSGESITYSPLDGGAPVTVVGNITYSEDIESENGNSGLEITRRRTITISTDAATGVAMPVEGDSAIFPDGRTYRLRGRPRMAAGGAVQELLFLSIETVNKGRQGARQTRR